MCTDTRVNNYPSVSQGVGPAPLGGHQIAGVGGASMCMILFAFFSIFRNFLELNLLQCNRD